ncbi:MAG TPA: NPCBM/NEW2 domain-containing protein [Gemmataceae bacterium]|nr:NPCBM/NEW2 domain-containing protein [Gemmataceae bacterium]
MPFYRALLTLVLLASVANADDVLRTLDNKTVSGNLVGVNDKEVLIKTNDGVVKTPLDNVIALDLRPVKGLAPGTAYNEIRLVDDTALLCGKYAIKGKSVEATLLSGQPVVIPMASVASILRGADDAKLRKAFLALLNEKVKRDRIVIYKGGDVNDLPGTIGEADAEGNKIKFLSEAGDIEVPIANLQGLIFFRPDGAGPVNPVCMVYDTAGNAIAAVKVVVDGKKATIVTTIPKVNIECDTAVIAKFDYNMGKLSFLSDLIPTKVVEKSGVGLIVAYRKDLNLDGDPIALEGRPYPKGLSLHAHTELEYDLKGKFKKFSAVLGVDPRVGSESQPKVTIEVDGKTVFSEIITTKNVRPIEVDVTKASSMRIIVSSQNFLDLHDHVTIANPKVTQ